MAAQERLLRSVCNLGPRLPRYIRIAASVHTDIDMFVYSQPALEQGAGEPQICKWYFPLPVQCSPARYIVLGSCLLLHATCMSCGFLIAGELLIHAHCYLHRPNLVPFGHRLPYAPHYFLKLKSADALVQVRLANHGQHEAGLRCV